MNPLFFGIAIVSLGWGIVSALVMTSFVSNRGYKINIPFFRIFVIKYIHLYSTITAEENGKPGVWFYSFIIAMNLALALTVAGLLLQ
jgi:uncharacterized protein YqjF (DUF2071 family)